VLVIGYYQGDRLVYAAQEWLQPASRAELFKKLKPLEIKECPFANLPEKKAGRWGADGVVPIISANIRAADRSNRCRLMVSATVSR
jgi:hypothetical protein